MVTIQSPSQLPSVKTAVAAVIGIVGGVLFKLHKSALEQLVQEQKDREIRTMIGLITNDDERNKAIQAYIEAQKRKTLWSRITGS